MLNIFRNKNIVLFLPLILWVLNQAFIFRPHLFFLAVAMGLLLLILTFHGLAIGKKKLDWPLFIYFPAILFLSASLYITLLANFYLIQVIVLLVSLMIFSYLKNFYYFFRYGAPERTEKLDNLMISSSVLSVFFLSAAAYGLPIFLGWKFWPLLAGLSFLVLLLFFQSFVLGRLNLKNNWPFFLASGLIFLELSGVIYLLPLSFHALGLIATIFFYLLLLILRLNLRGAFSGRTLRLPLIFGLSFIILLILTARWL